MSDEKIVSASMGDIIFMQQKFIEAQEGMELKRGTSEFFELDKNSFFAGFFVGFSRGKE